MLPPTDGPQASPGGLAPAPLTDPHGLPIRARVEAPTVPAGLPLARPASEQDLQRSLDRHIPAQWQDVVRQFLPLLVPLARVVMEVCEEVHGVKRPPQS